MTAGPSTLFVRPAAADEVSAGIAHLFSGYAQDYHALAGKAAAFQEQFVQHLTASAASYASAEAANMASLLKPLGGVVNLIGSAVGAVRYELGNIVSAAFDQLLKILGAAFYQFWIFIQGYPALWSIFVTVGTFVIIGAWVALVLLFIATGTPIPMFFPI
ncbi:hypothetical protein A5706_19450 [Mycobacterium sp. E796]|nr:hypothetical protein A5706_19450 [Mycobacterium sp. E796]